MVEYIYYISKGDFLYMAKLKNLQQKDMYLCNSTFVKLFLGCSDAVVLSFIYNTFCP